mmetsp:Transcript_131106/g.255486  ORF Transcript_131106/g.255486 Transcript_131106/m.255486 type:complete len:85 (-) Transcript_131106:185-439(-)
MRRARASVRGLLPAGLKGSSISLEFVPLQNCCKHCLLPTPTDTEQFEDDEQNFMEATLVGVCAIHAPPVVCCRPFRGLQAAVEV